MNAVWVWQRTWSGRRDFCDRKMMPFFARERARWARLRRKGSPIDHSQNGFVFRTTRETLTKVPLEVWMTGDVMRRFGEPIPLLDGEWKQLLDARREQDRLLYKAMFHDAFAFRGISESSNEEDAGGASEGGDAQGGAARRAARPKPRELDCITPPPRPYDPDRLARESLAHLERMGIAVRVVSPEEWHAECARRRAAMGLTS